MAFILGPTNRGLRKNLYTLYKRTLSSHSTGLGLKKEYRVVALCLCKDLDEVFSSRHRFNDTTAFPNLASRLFLLHDPVNEDQHHHDGRKEKESSHQPEVVQYERHGVLRERTKSSSPSSHVPKSDRACKPSNPRRKSLASKRPFAGIHTPRTGVANKSFFFKSLRIFEGSCYDFYSCPKVNRISRSLFDGPAFEEIYCVYWEAAYERKKEKGKGREGKLISGILDHCTRYQPLEDLIRVRMRGKLFPSMFGSVLERLFLVHDFAVDLASASVPTRTRLAEYHDQKDWWEKNFVLIYTCSILRLVLDDDNIFLFSIFGFDDDISEFLSSCWRDFVGKNDSLNTCWCLLILRTPRQRINIDLPIQQRLENDFGACFAHYRIRLFALLRATAFETSFITVTCAYSLASLYEQSIHKLEGLCADARARSTAFGIIESQACRSLAVGFLLLKLLECIFALGLDIAGHADDKVWHEREQSVFGCVDGSCHVQSSRLEDLQCATRHIEPHAFAENCDGWIIDFHCIQNATLCINLEEAKDYLRDSDGAKIVKNAREASSSSSTTLRP
ncbi:P-loop containing nucleoside triphosphate hydrolase protein, partial [Aureobasidium melanogenum]